MEVTELIQPEQVLCLHAGKKAQLLQDLVRRAAKASGLDVQAILDPVMAREALGSTGVGNGIAIPHARVPGIARFHALFAKLDKPIDFDAVDGQPVDLIVLLLVPEQAQKEHLTALACLSRRLREPEVARQLRALDEPKALYEVLTRAVPKPADGSSAKAPA